MDLLQLYYFMSVMEHRNITKAARAVFSTQPNVSKQILKLEQELGILLFERSSVGVQPTPSAHYLNNGLLEIRPRFENLIEKTKNVQINHTECVKIGFCDSMDFNRIMPGVFDDIKHSEPDFQVLIEAYSVEQVVEKLVLGEIDIGVIFSMMEANISGILRHPLNRANNMIYFSKRHPLCGKAHLKPMDFINEPFFQLATNIRKKDYEPYSCLPFVPKVIKVSSMNSILLNVESCNGVTLLGQSQTFFGKQTLATLEIDAKEHMVGGDAIWCVNNGNSALEKFLHYLYKTYPRESCLA